MDRQISQLTTASAPAVSVMRGDSSSPSKAKRIGRYLKNSVADFFGVGEEDERKRQQWDNRRVHYCSKFGKIKDECRPKTAEDEPDGLPMRNIYDPLRIRGRHLPSEPGSRRTTPLSSTSTYQRSTRAGPSQRRTRKDSVLQMTWKGISTLAGARKKLRKKGSMHNRSYTPASIYSPDILDDDYSLAASHHSETFSLVDDVFYDEMLPEFSRLDKIQEEKSLSDERPMDQEDKPRPGWRRPPPQPIPSTPGGEGYDTPDFALREISQPILNAVMERHKRQVGMGFMGRLLNRSFRSERITSDVKGQIDEIDDHRPYFTYWVTFVQIVVFLVSVSVYGIAPLGVDETTYTEPILKPNLAIELTSYIEIENIWIGPTQHDLIHLGAKYSPCMRADENIEAAIALDRKEEKDSGCCVRNDGSGCAQMVKSRCSGTLTTFVQWTAASNRNDSRTSGAVCGQDPGQCRTPASAKPFEWDKHDITKWPLCTNTSRPDSTLASGKDIHMTCEVVGHPCCFGIQGQCIITTRDHCEFIKGYFHEEAFLCSQAKCLKQICGMIPFANDDEPDQFYRLWTSLFLHGGLIHLLITLGFQMLIMRDVEKLTGALRMTIIYMGSGIAGNLASSIFLPYQVEVGPAGSQFGILSCLLVEVLQNWQMLKRPVIAIAKIGGLIILLFIIGLLPWVDNWAHLFGFLFGFLIAFALMPYVSFGKFDRRRKIISIIVSLGSAVGLFVLLVILFYVVPLYNCPACQYFNCIPFTPNFCKNMELSIKRTSSYSDV